jgi:hypothetical protein
MSEHQYELKHPFEYAGKTGEMISVGFITITAPTFKQLDKVAPIKQAFTAAIKEVTDDLTPDTAEKADTAGGDKIDGAQAMALLYRWSGDITKVLLYAAQLFKDAALVDGEEKLTTPLLNKMHLSDFEGLLGMYLANFIVPSLMDGQ